MKQQMIEKNGKKVIKPVVEHVYNNQVKLDPFENPFYHQQLNQHHYYQMSRKERSTPQRLSNSIQPGKNPNFIDQSKAKSPKLPTFQEAFKQPNPIPLTENKKSKVIP
jgi:hypothetical protein